VAARVGAGAQLVQQARLADARLAGERQYGGAPAVKPA
jgi:hypothetical protein